MKIKTPDRSRAQPATERTRGLAASEHARREPAGASPRPDAPKALALLSAGDAVTRHQAGMAVQRWIGNRATAQVLERLAPSIPQAAQGGVRGSGDRMPHFDTIQRAFGRHDIRHVQAYADAAAASACRAIGAEAYTTGSKVAFSGPPSLHTAAHEAAHTVQQRAGVQLKGGVGEAGDRYEQHAEAVADAVVQGRSAEALLDAQIHAQPGPAASTEAPVQRTLAMSNHANPVSAAELATALESPLPNAYARFLPALESSAAAHTFATNDSGKVPLATAKDVIASAKDSFVVDGNSWSFVILNDGSWEDIQRATESDGTELVEHEGANGSKWLVTIDRSILPQVTQTVLNGVKALEIAQRTPKATMVLPTGLTYEHVVRKEGRIDEIGVLGGKVLSVTPKVRDVMAASVALKLRGWFKPRYNALEPFQMDPRHIGIHDGNDMGTVNHYHLILQGGVTDVHTQAVTAKWAALEQQEIEKEEKTHEMAAFLKVRNLSPGDAKQKQALVAERNKNGPNKALKLWEKIRGTLDWWKAQQQPQ